jgi:inward rectifier potassium channel
MADTPLRRRPLPTQQFPAIHAVGLHRAPFEDFYHSILVRPWWQFVLLVAAAFVGVNALFALAYLLGPESVSNVRPGSFEDAFYFSVQTLGTIGYGNMSPVTRYGHVIVTIEAFTGILSVAVITGVTFAKFSRPTARVLFSAKVAAPTRHGVPHLQFRMANQRRNMVVEAQLRALVLVAEETPEGERIRRPIDLALVRDRTALFTLTWTAMHIIDEKSPFYGPGALERLRAQGGEIFLSFSGVDETFAQLIHARHRYGLDDIAWNARFADVLQVAPDGTRVIDYQHFDEVVPLETNGAAAAAETTAAG